MPCRKIAWNAVSPSRDKLESALRAAVGKLVPGLSKDGYDQAMNYIGIWRALKSHNRRLYKRLETDADVGGEEWRAHVDCLVEMVGRDLAPMARLIGRKLDNGSMDRRKLNAVARTSPDKINERNRRFCVPQMRITLQACSRAS